MLVAPRQMIYIAYQNGKTCATMRINTLVLWNREGQRDPGPEFN
jgi:hypothetical protein